MAILHQRLFWKLKLIFNKCLGKIKLHLSTSNFLRNKLNPASYKLSVLLTLLSCFICIPLNQNFVHSAETIDWIFFCHFPFSSPLPSKSISTDHSKRLNINTSRNTSINSWTLVFDHIHPDTQKIFKNTTPTDLHPLNRLNFTFRIIYRSVSVQNTCILKSYTSVILHTFCSSFTIPLLRDRRRFWGQHELLWSSVLIPHTTQYVYSIPLCNTHCTTISTATRRENLPIPSFPPSRNCLISISSAINFSKKQVLLSFLLPSSFISLFKSERMGTVAAWSCVKACAQECWLPEWGSWAVWDSPFPWHTLNSQ